MSEQEFIDRDRQLGPDTRQKAPGVGKQAALDATPRGEPDIDYTVRSVYDSRPINGKDFNVVVSSVSIGSGSGTIWDLTFSVPDGYVAIMRQIEIWTEPAINFSRSEVLLEPILNGGSVSNNQDYIGGATGAPMECFVIADAMQIIGARLSMSAAASSAFKFYAHLYGNLLLKTGRAASLEVGNFAGGVSLEGKRG